MEQFNGEKYIARFERIENTLEVLAESQKQVGASQLWLTGEVGKIASAVVKVTEGQVVVVESQVAIIESQARTVAMVDRLVEAQARTTADVDRLVEAQAKSDLKSQEIQEKLDALIHMWDDWIRERRAKEGDGPSIQ